MNNKHVRATNSQIWPNHLCSGRWSRSYKPCKNLAPANVCKMKLNDFCLILSIYLAALVNSVVMVICVVFPGALSYITLCVVLVGRCIVLLMLLFLGCLPIIKLTTHAFMGAYDEN